MENIKVEANLFVASQDPETKLITIESLDKKHSAGLKADEIVSSEELQELAVQFASYVHNVMNKTK